jgi:hypothetical protein
MTPVFLMTVQIMPVPPPSFATPSYASGLGKKSFHAGKMYTAAVLAPLAKQSKQSTKPTSSNLSAVKTVTASGPSEDVYAF